MPTEKAIVYEYRLDREIPNAAGFAAGLSGVALLFFSITFHNEGAPTLLGAAGLLLLLLSIFCFTFNQIIRMDKRSGEITEILSSILWKRTRNYKVSDFTGVGIGMGGHGSRAMSTRYFVQLLGSKNLKIPGTSSNKQSIISLAEQIGDYLSLPVEKEPKAVFFQTQ